MNNSQSKVEPMTPRKTRRGLGCIVAVAVLLLAVAGAAVIWGQRVLDLLPTQTQAPSLPIEDRTSPEQLAEQRTREMRRLHSFGWVDQDAEIVHIPIERAIALVAENGLPVGEVMPEDNAPPDGEPAGDTPTDVAADPPIDPATLTYQKDILPIFEEYCGECHGAEDPEENLELTRYRPAMVGSQNGPVIEPGDPDASYLVEQIVEGRMPKDRDPLPQHAINTIIAWITAGAPEN